MHMGLGIGSTLPSPAPGSVPDSTSKFFLNPHYSSLLISQAQAQTQTARARRPSTSTSTSTSTSCSISMTHHHNDKQIIKRFRGVRMRKWGKWVAEIRQPNKRTRIWLGSYSTPLAAAKAYDTAVFYLRGRSGRLNFPDEVAHDCDSDCATAHRGELSADLIRKKAAEVGARVDAAMQAAEAEGHVKEEEGLQRDKRNGNENEIERDKRKKAWRASFEFDLNESPSVPVPDI